MTLFTLLALYPLLLPQLDLVGFCACLSLFGPSLSPQSQALTLFQLRALPGEWWITWYDLNCRFQKDSPGAFSELEMPSPVHLALSSSQFDTSRIGGEGP